MGTRLAPGGTDQNSRLGDLRPCQASEVSVMLEPMLIDEEGLELLTEEQALDLLRAC